MRTQLEPWKPWERFSYLFTSLSCVGLMVVLSRRAQVYTLPWAHFLCGFCYFKQLLFDEENSDERRSLFHFGFTVHGGALICSKAAGRGSHGRTRQGALNPCSRWREGAPPPAARGHICLMTTHFSRRDIITDMGNEFS